MDRIYQLPCRGSQRSFNLDISEMTLGEIEADIYMARQRLVLETGIFNCSYLRRRLTLLAARRAEFKRGAA